MGTTADIKTKIIQLDEMGMSYSKIQDAIKRSVEYIEKVVNEYKQDGTITVNSKLNKIEL